MNCMQNRFRVVGLGDRYLVRSPLQGNRSVESVPAQGLVNRVWLNIDANATYGPER